MTPPPVVLTLRALGLGDLLTGVPAMRALRRAFPDHRHVLACPRPLAPLARLAGVCDEVVDIRGLVPVPVSRPAVAVDLHGRGPQSHRVLLATQPGRLLAFRHAAVPASRGMPRWKAAEHEVCRWCRMLAESGIPADPADLRIAGDGLPAPDAARSATLLHPGAGHAARRWPPERWARVAAELAAAGERVAVTAGPGERDLAATVVRAAGLPVSALLEPAGILELAGAVAAARRAVCGDTGVAHLATALSTPLVALFGPTPPALWGPPADHPHVALWKGTRGDPNADRPDPGLLAIAPEAVGDALRALPC